MVDWLFFFLATPQNMQVLVYFWSFNFQSATCLWSSFNVQKSLVREWWTMQSAAFVWLRQWVVLRRLWSDSLSKMGNEKKRPELPFNYPTIHHVACTNIRRHRWDLVFKFKEKKTILWCVFVKSDKCGRMVFLLLFFSIRSERSDLSKIQVSVSVLHTFHHWPV